MFDANRFKRAVKDWVRSNPQGSLAEFVDFCEDQIPPSQFSSHQWLVEQSVSWYRHVLANRETLSRAGDEDDDEVPEIVVH